MLRIFLPQLDGWNARAARRPRATPSSASASSCELPADEPGHVYHLFVVPLARARPHRAPRCRRPEIGCASYYVTPLHLQPALRYLGYAAGRCPRPSSAPRENFSVPLWAGIDADTQERVVDVVRAAAPACAA